METQTVTMGFHRYGKRQTHPKPECFLYFFGKLAVVVGSSTAEAFPLNKRHEVVLSFTKNGL